MRWRHLSFRTFWAFSVLVPLGAATSVAACSAAATSSTKKPGSGDDNFDDFVEEDPTPIEPTYTDDEAGTVAQDRPKGDGGSSDAATRDGGTTQSDAGACGALALGDLQIVEIMISSRSGAGDEGEWVEIRNMRNCTITLSNITVESPRGAVADTVTLNVTDKLLPGESFIVASSSDKTKNNNLPGKVFAWNTTDVLKNDGDVVRVLRGTTVLDTVTYPRFSNLTPGRSLAFPSDCDPMHHPTWERWSQAFGTWPNAPAGMRGTPNAPNDDVACF